MFCADDQAARGPGETWRWRELTNDDAAAATTGAPGDGIKDERWLALKMLARKTNAGTRDGYRRDINTFMTWWSEAVASRAPLDARKTDLEDYATALAHLEIRPATQLRRLAVVSAFYELAIDEALRTTTPMRGVERPKAGNEDAILGLQSQDAEKLLRAAEAWDEPRAGALTVLLLLRGLRISEALSLRPVDMTPRERDLQLEILRKGARQTRTSVYVDDQWLIGRLRELADSPEAIAPLFGDLNRFSAGRAVATIGRRAGLDHLHPHVLRHTFVSQLLAAGMPLRDVQKLAGHASIATTQRYADALNESARVVSRVLRKRFTDAASLRAA